MTENAREAGPGQTPGPVREHVVIRDKRKIDPSGQPRNPQSDGKTSGSGKPADDAASRNHPGTPAGGPVHAEATLGTATDAAADSAPTGSGTSGTDGSRVGEAVEADIIDAEEIVGGEIITSAPAPASFAAELESLRSELDERLRDLQRVTAEYANYRKRVDRDRSAVVEQAIGMVVTALLPILDDLDRAREHDDLVGPSAAMAEQLGAALAKFGLTPFGEPGDAFDPTRHEAVAHQTSADVTEPTCVAVMRRGYVLGDRLLRAALVAVADPE